MPGFDYRRPLYYMVTLKSAPACPPSPPSSRRDSSPVEAAARILVTRRCTRAGMHWRIGNAVRVCALLAHIHPSPPWQAA